MWARATQLHGRRGDVENDHIDNGNLDVATSTTATSTPVYPPPQRGRFPPLGWGMWAQAAQLHEQRDYVDTSRVHDNNMATLTTAMSTPRVSTTSTWLRPSPRLGMWA